MRMLLTRMLLIRTQVETVENKRIVALFIRRFAYLDSAIRRGRRSPTIRRMRFGEIR